MKMMRRKDQYTDALIQFARDGADHEEEPKPLDLGEHVRALRKERRLTLEAAASQAGVARSTLSKIENGLMSPTYDVLKKLAQGLEIAVPQLFQPAHRSRNSGRLAVTTRGSGTALATATYEHEILAGQLPTKSMLPYRTHVRARKLEEFDGWVRHDGEEFLFVLSGIIELYTEFYEPVTMRRGDSVYYDATMGHNVISLGPDDATILWITYLE